VLALGVRALVLVEEVEEEGRPLVEADQLFRRVGPILMHGRRTLWNPPSRGRPGSKRRLRVRRRPKRKVFRRPGLFVIDVEFDQRNDPWSR
jgi:hypothetical protein